MRTYWKQLVAVAIAACLGSAANAQVVSLLVGNQTSFNALDYYAFPSGAYQGAFAGPGTGPPGTAYFSYGPNGNVFLFRNTNPTPLLQFNGMTGNLIGTFVSDSGGAFAFGPDGNLYRANTAGTAILRYSGTTGQFLNTFTPSGLTLSRMLHFGPNGDLFVADGNTIQRINGNTGALIGPFTPIGAGGLTNAFDFVFTPSGKLVVSGVTGGNNDRLLQFDGTTGGFLGDFAQGNGLNAPIGLTIGPDANLYVASTLGNSIQRFDVLTGQFLGDFVSATAHPNPTYLQFSPFPIPEPSGLLLLGLFALSGGLSAARRLNRQKNVNSKAPSKSRESC